MNASDKSRLFFFFFLNLSSFCHLESFCHLSDELGHGSWDAADPANKLRVGKYMSLLRSLSQNCSWCKEFCRRPLQRSEISMVSYISCSTPANLPLRRVARVGRRAGAGLWGVDGLDPCCRWDLGDSISSGSLSSTYVPDDVHILLFSAWSWSIVMCFLHWSHWWICILSSFGWSDLGHLGWALDKGGDVEVMALTWLLCGSFWRVPLLWLRPLHYFLGDVAGLLSSVPEHLKKRMFWWSLDYLDFPFLVCCLEFLLPFLVGVTYLN